MTFAELWSCSLRQASSDEDIFDPYDHEPWLTSLDSIDDDHFH